MRIMVGIPVHRSVDYATFISFMKLFGHRGEHIFDFTCTSSSLIYDVREKMVEGFLKSSCDAILFIDSDMTFEPKDIEKLASYNLPFVTAMAFKRTPPFQPCFYTKLMYENNQPLLEVPIDYSEGILEIEGAGMACVLIKREVFKNLKKPYFFPKRGLGEDLTFCLKLKKAGVKMYCDTTTSFGHLSNVEVTEKYFKEYYQKCLNEGVDMNNLYGK
jgi:GT2 family glycosyltransferase